MEFFMENLILIFDKLFEIWKFCINLYEKKYLLFNFLLLSNIIIAQQ